MTGGVLEGMVIVVPTFSIGHDGNPPAVGGAIARIVGLVAKFVSCTVHQPGAMKHHN